MNGFSISVDWINGDRVRSAELAATWAAINVSINGADVTVVRDTQTGSHRASIFASAYPLGEWIAFNWWRLTTPGGGGIRRGGAINRVLSLRDAGDGFHWPNLRVQPNEDSVDLRATAEDSAEERINYVIEGNWTVDLNQFESSLRAFVESVTERLEQEGIRGTPLQLEWQAIHDLDTEEVDFCRAAAALGEDPFDPDLVIANELLSASEQVQSADLLVEMLAASPQSAVLEGAAWLAESEHLLASMKGATASIADLKEQIPERHKSINKRYLESPWVVGFQHARDLRNLMGLGLNPVQESLVSVAYATRTAPQSIDGLVGLDAPSPLLVIPHERSKSSERFLQARSLHRALFTASSGAHVVTNGRSLRDQVERAFAAEFLAPANAIAIALKSDTGERAVARAAKEFGVAEIVIEHQIENQISV
jgi:hypothetical protein